MKKPIAVVALLLSVSHATAQKAVTQSGNVTPGHSVMWTTNGVVQDAGTAVAGFLTGLGVVAQGPGICQRSGPTTGAYNQLCITTSSTGGGFTFTGFGGATGVPNFVLNGISYPFPFTSSGAIGPSTTTVGHLATWANTTGTLLADTVPPTPVSAGTANQLAYYAADGSVVSGLAAGNNCFYLTNGSGVPSCSPTVGFNVQLGSMSQSFGINNLAGFGNNPWTGTSANDAGGGGSNTWLGSGAGPGSQSGAYASSGTLGSENVAIGYVSGLSITTGSANITIGGGAGAQNNTGSENSDIGRHAQRANHSGSTNVIVGEFANNGNDGPQTFGVFSFTGHVDNGSGGTGSLLTVTAISGTPLKVPMHIAGSGLSADACEIISLGSGTGGTGTYNLDCLGNTGSEAMTAALADASFSTCLGANACYFTADGDNISAQAQATAVGYKAYYYGFTGQNNVAIGFEAMQGNASVGTTGGSNVGIGLSACSGITSGTNNTCLGGSAGTAGPLAAAVQNTFLGSGAGYEDTGSGNTLVGYGVGSSITSGTGNTMIGPAATFPGPGITTGSYNTIIGNAPTLSAGLANAIILADGQSNIKADYNETTASNWTFAGPAAITGLANVATTSAVCYNTSSGLLTYDGTIGTCNTSTMRVKHDIKPLNDVALLDGVLQMKPVKFKYNDEVHTPGEQMGLVAEDLATIDPHLVAYDNEGKPVSIRYLGPMFSYLIGAIKEQQRQIDALRGRSTDIPN